MSKRHAPAALRNRDPILEVLQRFMPRQGHAVEIASGSGEHVIHFARHFPEIRWQPCDVAPDALESIRAWVAEASLPNIDPPLLVDASADAWPVESCDVLLNINMIHISPWAACEGLMRGAQRTIAAGGILYLYGPYNVGGAFTSESNRTFDASLRQRNGSWGLRDVEAVIALAEQHGLSHLETVSMPANNLSVIFRRGEV